MTDIGLPFSGPATAAYTGDSATRKPLWLDASGAGVVIDFYAKALLDGRGYQVRAGTLSAPLVGDVVITDTAAEYCVDGSTGHVFMPYHNCISINLGTGTLFEFAIKEVATVSSSGTAFVLLPLRAGASAASGISARVSAAGGVTVSAELATTTTRHWSADQPIAMGAYWMNCNWEPLRPPPVMGARCLYTQIAATTTGPSYYANMNVVRFTQTELGL